jgi:hypothetical protein
MAFLACHTKRRRERRFMMQPVENANFITTMLEPRKYMLAVVISKLAFPFQSNTELKDFLLHTNLRM